ncbi:hypothetical protein DdX_20511 [Ditylenchus destructor]|uniref:Secreted protein n=1 Tax=Ditylenchus destructor TaxID=166010 RepID=A0AAD4QRT6_9BILA|nr:hypothetical protein DdX_20511 [Ditylenchus destructor]
MNFLISNGVLISTLAICFCSADDQPAVPAQVQPLANGLEQGKSQFESAASQFSNGMPGMSGMPNPSNFSSGMENAFNQGKQQVENGAMQGGMQLASAGASGMSQMSNMSPVGMSVPGGGTLMSKVGNAAGNTENLAQMPGESNKDQPSETGGDDNDAENGNENDHTEAPKNGTKGEKKKGKKKGKGKKHGDKKKHPEDDSTGGSVNGTANGSGAELSASMNESK